LDLCGVTAFFGGFEAFGCAVPRLDVACLPLGAYEPRWFMAGQHMAPEHSLMAFQHLRAQHFVGMHWGTYDLSDEPIDAGPALLRSLLGEPAAPDPGRIHVLRPGGVLSFGGRAKATAFGRFA
jgi:L-ascorbate metabolism protein UlaG (beta-lactamase superfamily)